MNRILGQTTTYQGTEHPYLCGHKVLIVAVLKSKARPDLGHVSDDYDYIDDEEELASVGGVTGIDRLEVQPWLEQAGRFSFAASDARALDLELFRHLKASR